MNEQELQQKRQEFRDQEVMKKIAHYTDAAEYRHQTLRTNYTRKKVDRRLGKMGTFLIFTQVLALLFFCGLWGMSYISHTKKIVTMVMP